MTARKATKALKTHDIINVGTPEKPDWREVLGKTARRKGTADAFYLTVSNPQLHSGQWFHELADKGWEVKEETMSDEQSKQASADLAGDGVENTASLGSFDIVNGYEVEAGEKVCYERGIENVWFWETKTTAGYCHVKDGNGQRYHLLINDQEHGRIIPYEDSDLQLKLEGRDLLADSAQTIKALNEQVVNLLASREAAWDEIARMKADGKQMPLDGKAIIEHLGITEYADQLDIVQQTAKDLERQLAEAQEELRAEKDRAAAAELLLVNECQKAKNRIAELEAANTKLTQEKDDGFAEFGQNAIRMAKEIAELEAENERIVGIGDRLIKTRNDEIARLTAERDAESKEADELDHANALLRATIAEQNAKIEALGQAATKGQALEAAIKTVMDIIKPEATAPVISEVYHLNIEAKS